MEPSPPVEQQPPSQPTARQLRAARISGELPAQTPVRAFRPGAAAVRAGFAPTKRDRRLIRRSVRIGRIGASAVAARDAKRAWETRHGMQRPTAGSGSIAAGSSRNAARSGSGAGSSSINRQPTGSARRRKRNHPEETEAFFRQLARLTTLTAEVMHMTDGESDNDGEPAEAEAVGTSMRWQTLRGSIAASQDENPAFAAASS